MNVQLPLVDVLPQPTKPGAASPATNNGDSFAAILNQAAQPDQKTLALLKGSTALPQQALALKAILHNGGQLSAELLVDAPEEGLIPADLAGEAPLEETIAAEDAALAAVDSGKHNLNTQAANANSSSANTEVRQKPAALADTATGERSTASLVSAHQAAATEGSSTLSTERLEMAVAKPGATTNLEASNLQTNAGHQTLSSGAAARPVLTAPLASPQWQNDLSQQVSGFVMRGDSRVSLQLNPSDLGPLVVELKIVEQNAQLQFVSAQSAVRSAVEQAIPQLRDALAEQGIDLGEVNVGGHNPQQEQSASAESKAGLNDTEDSTDPDPEAAELALDISDAPLPGQLSIYV